MRIINSPGGRSLRLMHAAVEDAGRYTCIVSNAAGEEKKNFDLDILGKVSLIHFYFFALSLLLNGSELFINNNVCIGKDFYSHRFFSLLIP